MAELLTVDQVKPYVPDSADALDDESLLRYIDAAEAYLIRYAGPNCIQDTETVSRQGVIKPGGLIRLGRPARQVDSLRVKYWQSLETTASVEVGPDRYQIIYSGRTIAIFPNFFVGWYYDITYRPIQDLEARRLCLIQLVQNALMYTGVDSYNDDGTRIQYGMHWPRIVNTFTKVPNFA